MIPKRYLEKDSWPHQFTGTGRVEEGPSFTTYTENRCYFCDLKYWHGKEPRPIGKCPARSDKSEYRRLGVD